MNITKAHLTPYLGLLRTKLKSSCTQVLATFSAIFALSNYTLGPSFTSNASGCLVRCSTSSSSGYLRPLIPLTWTPSHRTIIVLLSLSSGNLPRTPDCPLFWVVGVSLPSSSGYLFTLLLLFQSLPGSSRKFSPIYWWCSPDQLPPHLHNTETCGCDRCVGRSWQSLFIYWVILGSIVVLRSQWSGYCRHQGLHLRSNECFLS